MFPQIKQCVHELVQCAQEEARTHTTYCHTAKLCFKFRYNRRVLGFHPRSVLLSLTAIFQVCVDTNNSRMWTNYLVNKKKTQVDN